MYVENEGKTAYAPAQPTRNCYIIQEGAHRSRRAVLLLVCPHACIQNKLRPTAPDTRRRYVNACTTTAYNVIRDMLIYRPRRRERATWGGRPPIWVRLDRVSVNAYQKPGSERTRPKQGAAAASFWVGQEGSWAGRHLWNGNTHAGAHCAAGCFCNLQLHLADASSSLHCPAMTVV